MKLTIPTKRPLHWSFYAYIPFLFFVLWLDSMQVLRWGLDGQSVANLITPLYYFAMLKTMPDPTLRRIILITVPIAAVGEYFFSILIRLYTYKYDMVPIYVPFGHAIVIGSGFQLLWSQAVQQRARLILWTALATYGALILGAYALYGDTLSLALWAVYLLAVAAARERLLILLMPILVLFVEFVGTAFGCWVWQRHPLNGLLSTTNPPIGSLALYVWLDVIVVTAGVWLARAPLPAIAGFRGGPRPAGPAN